MCNLRHIFYEDILFMYFSLRYVVSISGLFERENIDY